jgi:hypothetical protein
MVRCERTTGAAAPAKERPRTAALVGRLPGQGRERCFAAVQQASRPALLPVS